MTLELTEKDWNEIYYALETKRLALEMGQLDDYEGEIKEPGSKTEAWLVHINKIIGKIGPDGKNMVETEAEKPAKQYMGTRWLGGLGVFVVENQSSRRLPHVVLHSPDGYEWGYAGSGPADLALSILADYFGEPAQTVKEGRNSKAYRLHQSFKDKFLTNADKLNLKITSEQIVDWLESR